MDNPVKAAQTHHSLHQKELIQFLLLMLQMIHLLLHYLEAHL